jgi:hypothetical protein
MTNTLGYLLKSLSWQLGNRCIEQRQHPVAFSSEGCAGQVWLTRASMLLPAAGMVEGTRGLAPIEHEKMAARGDGSGHGKEGGVESF